MKFRPAFGPPSLSHLLCLSLLLATGCMPPPQAPNFKPVNQNDGDQQGENPNDPDDPEEQDDPEDNPDDPVTPDDPEMPDEGMDDPVKPEPNPEPKPEPMPEPKPEPVPEISKDGDGKFTLNNYPKDALVVENTNKLKGSVKSFSMNGSDSKIFNGNYKRNVYVYIPEGTDANKEMPFLFGFDAQWFFKDTVIGTVDNLIQKKLLPPMIVIYLDNRGDDGVGSKRAYEYDRVSGDNPKFLVEEVLPRVAKEYNVKFTTDPSGGGTIGGSSGGIAAFTAAYMMPERFQRVVSYSGSFVRQGADKTYPRGGWEYHEHLIKEAAQKNIRVSLQAGQRDNDIGEYYQTLPANEGMFKALNEKGYHVRYNYSQDCGHVDARAVLNLLATDLQWAWRGYPIAGK